MGHTHGHDHGHSHAPANYGRAFAVSIALNLGFVAVEAAYGILSHSLALLADAGHNLSDVLSLALAWAATLLVRRLPTPRRTYGLKRSSILVSLANAALLLVAIGAIAWESVGRLAHPEPVAGGTVVGVALVGIAINGLTALMFASGRKGDVNIRGAYLHMAADAGVSFGVVLAGLAIRATGWAWLDPAVSLGIAAAILWGTWGLLRESLDLALDAVPKGTDVHAIEEYLASIKGVVDVHDLHVWGISTTETALTAHLVVPERVVDDRWLAGVCDALHEKFEVEHATIQVEHALDSSACRLAPSYAT